MTIENLYPMYFDEITRYALKLVRNRPSAEDVAQEVFLRALKNSHVLTELSEAKARAWLYTTARNIVIDQARREKRRPLLEEIGIHEDDLSGIWVETLMGALPVDERRLISLRYFADMTSTDIGEMLGLPSATVRTRLRAAVKRLRVAYWEKGGH